MRDAHSPIVTPAIDSEPDESNAPSKPKVFQVLMTLRACAYVYADSQQEAEARAEALTRGAEAVKFSVLATGELHNVTIDEGEVLDVDEV